jgi:hypothetical protein
VMWRLRSAESQGRSRTGPNSELWGITVYLWAKTKAKCGDSSLRSE